MRGELIFDTRDLVIMKDSEIEDCFFAIDREKFITTRNDYYDSIRAAQRTNDTVTAPDLEVTLLVKKEGRKFDLGTMQRTVGFDHMKGVLISCN